MHRRTSFLAFCVVLAAASLGLAAIAPQSEAELNRAKVIVVGKVVGTYREIKRDAEWEKANGVVEIEVEKVERGENIKSGDVIFARFDTQWWIKKNEPPPPYGTGHYLYENGTQVRAHLGLGNGAYRLLVPNGLVPSKKDAVRIDMPRDEDVKKDR